ncbi:4'-phosphopantetheinyl transferase superfamily protein [Streptomyces mauvecolor]
MSAPPRRPMGEGQHERDLAFAPGLPWRVLHIEGGPTLTVVSIAWLHRRGPAMRAALESQHLSAPEAAHAGKLILPKRRLDWFAGRLAVKSAVAAHFWRHSDTRVRTRDVHVEVETKGLRAGKPHVDLPLGVGLAHSGDFAVAACGPNTIGVDLERNRPMGPHFADLLAVPPAVEPGARRRLEDMPLPLRWACKEAVLKAFGFGLRFDPREVRLTTWCPDGGFTWRLGPEIAAYAPPGDSGSYRSLVREIDGYAFALVWR